MKSKKVSVFLVSLVSIIILLTGTAGASEIYKNTATIIGDAAKGRLYFPTNVAVYSTGEVFVTDFPSGINERLSRFNPGPGYTLKWGSDINYSGGPCYFEGIAVDNEDRPYILRVSDGTSELWVERYWQTGSYNGAIPIFDVEYPEGFALDNSGGFYVLEGGTDESYGRVIKYDSFDSHSRQPSAQFGDDYLEYPTAITTDKQGFVYVADVTEVVKFDSKGQRVAEIQSPIADALSETQSIAVDADGNIYAASDDYIIKFNQSGKLLNKWGSHGSGSGQFNGLADITVDNSGKVYAVDAGNNRIQVFTLVNDVTKPTGSVGFTVGGLTKTRNVTLRTAATDADAGVGYMMISNTSTFTGAAWLPYSAYKAWSLPLGDGAKTVYVKYMDNAGNVSPVYTAKTVLDTKVPTGKLVINKGLHLPNPRLLLSVSLPQTAPGLPRCLSPTAPTLPAQPGFLTLLPKPGP